MVLGDRWLFRAAGLLLTVVLAGGMAGCAGRKGERAPSYEPESFGGSAHYSRHFDATPSQACEAARRALLGQGYIITAAAADQVTGRKFFQPSIQVHVPLEMRVVCAPEAAPENDLPQTVVFAVAIQEVHELRKANSSASLGVGGLGSLSLPIEGGSDGMVKVGTQTVTDGKFYESFFVLVHDHIETSAKP